MPSGHFRKGANMFFAHWAPQEGGYHVWRPVGTSGRGLSCFSPTGHLRKGAIMSVAHWAPQEGGYHVCRPLGTSGRGLSCLSPTGYLRKGAIMSVAHWVPQEGGYHACHSVMIYFHFVLILGYSRGHVWKKVPCQKGECRLQQFNYPSGKYS